MLDIIGVKSYVKAICTRSMLIKTYNIQLVDY